MARRGPKPKPTALKLLKGVRADRVNAKEPTAEAGLPVAPGYLDHDGLAEWDRITPLLSKMGVLTTIDGAALALYCDTYSRWLRARAAIDDHGLLIVSENEYGTVTKLNPAASLVAAFQRAMVQLLTEFGCTPSSRSRVQSVKKDEDALGSYLAKKG